MTQAPVRNGATPATDMVFRGEALHKRYAQGGAIVAALDGVDVTVSPGELLAIMGPSGCGKSTLLHLLAGIDVPSAGHVLFRGLDLSGKDGEERAYRRRASMGLLFQTHALLPGLTAGENVALPLAFAGVDRTTRDRRAAELLSMVGLENRAGDAPDDLSGGQRQRVALARALANDPVVVLADEPTGSLDGVTAREVLDAIVSLLRVRGTALVMVTHDSAAAARADRVVTLRDGRVESAGGASWAALEVVR